MRQITSAADIPALTVTARCLPEAWEKAVLAVWEQGIEVKTEYDRVEDRPSKDATVLVTVAEPFAEPRIHKNFPGGPAELEAYRQEVVSGIHDHWIDPAAGKWTYTYHQRLFAYCPVQDLRNQDTRKPFQPVDQIDYIVRALAGAGHTRRAQAITWIPTADIYTNDPPCLQRVWCRLVPEGAGWRLNMNTHWRSRDLYRAWFMNAYALTELQRLIAKRIEEKLDVTVAVGRYVDVTDSLHLYGSYLNQVATEAEKMRDGSFNERAWPTTHPAFLEMTEEARSNLAKDPDFYARGECSDCSA